MGTEAGELEKVGFFCFVDQKQVRLEVTFAVVFPVADQSMIAVVSGQRLIFCEKQKDRYKHLRQIGVTRISQSFFEILFETCRSFNRPHLSPPSIRQRW